MRASFMAFAAAATAMWSSIARCAAADPSARDVLDKAAQAMGPPVRYRMSVNGVDSVVTAVVLQDGKLCMRTETVAPTFTRITLSVGEEHYEWYPKTKIGIDIGLIRGRIKDQAAALAATPASGKLNSEVRFLPETTRSGRRCYVVEEIVPKTLLAAVASTLPTAAKAPMFGTRHSVIDKETLLLYEVSAKDAEAKHEQIITMSDVRKGDNFPRDLLLPPDGYDFKRVASIEEYVAMMTRGAWGEKDATAKVVRVGRTKIDPDTGRYIVPTPEGMTREQFDHMVRDLDLKQQHQRASDRQQARENAKNTRLIIYLIIGLILLLTSAVFIRLRVQRR
jgi:hypothetical protein